MFITQTHTKPAPKMCSVFFMRRERKKQSYSFPQTIKLKKNNILNTLVLYYNLNIIYLTISVLVVFTELLISFIFSLNGKGPLRKQGVFSIYIYYCIMPAR